MSGSSRAKVHHLVGHRGSSVALRFATLSCSTNGSFKRDGATCPAHKIPDSPPDPTGEPPMATASRSLATALWRARSASGLLRLSYTTLRDTTPAREGPESAP
jgi:hypothetical protein